MGRGQSPLEAVAMMADFLDFYRGRRVLVTGHTGFKGAWLCRILSHLGARVTGYSLEPKTTPSLFEILKNTDQTHTVYGDIRDSRRLYEVFGAARPEVVFHLAAQPLVREGYCDPVGTYETNVQGTVNLLECVRKTGTVRSFLNVTTDKVYFNREWEWGYRENDRLCGLDPYSNSKSCAELVTYSYKQSFLAAQGVAVSTARAGNVIGGGDFAPDRIIPDCVRAAVAGEPIVLRNPNATRPYQHVLDPLFAYLLIAARGYQSPNLADCYNVGPNDCDCVTNKMLATLLVRAWGGEIPLCTGSEKGPHEATFLKLDSSRIKKQLGFEPRLGIGEAVELTVAWSKAFYGGLDAVSVTDQQIDDYIEMIK